MQCRKNNTYFIIASMLLCFVFTSPQTAHGDIIFPSPDESPAFLSLELVGDLEYPLSEKACISLWGGVGRLIGIAGGFTGYELGLEGRYYFREEKSGWLASVYAGFASMHSDDSESYSGFTPGVKLTFVKPIKRFFIIEPYFSMSYPRIFFLPEGDFPKFYPVLTLGLRFGLRHILYTN
jgi:hypothetical protein